ncbi:iron-containing redox enzyme family protein [Acinetobacter soli]|uniref:iron-containing redox enzyme family protein n=1 Tax=Acinetobacter soli TaxID=487316 RepID=UPI001250C6D4|nr:iron-containing redox enzyme family protein [Acinetobacter soli]
MITDIDQTYSCDELTDVSQLEKYCSHSPNISAYECVQELSSTDCPLTVKQNIAIKYLNYWITNNTVSDEFPLDLEQLKNWLELQNNQACKDFQTYLERRKNLGKREYFGGIANAFEFLIKIAPTKRVDGAWLYSLCHQWKNPAFEEAIGIYLDELGTGIAALNHVYIYDNLMNRLGLNDFDYILDDSFFIQAALQLSFAYAPSDYIPEIIGFNLGYEQLPLHLLISNYELKELGIDAQYFNLHITVDNFDSGHAQSAFRSVKKIMDLYPDRDAFLQRVKIGYYLNDVGVGSTQIVKQLHLGSLVEKILVKKAKVGRLVHSEKCRIEGRDINSWLDTEQSTKDFLNTLIKRKWINIGQDAQNSRFWKMINDAHGIMFGVFNSAEKRFIHDWIEQDGVGDYNDRLKLKHLEVPFQCQALTDIDPQTILLKQRYHSEADILTKIGYLIDYLSPHQHHTQSGMWATKEFTQILYPKLAERFEKL